MEKERVELWQAEDIAGKLAVVQNYTGLELLALDNLGEIRGRTAAGTVTFKLNDFISTVEGVTAKIL